MKVIVSADTTFYKTPDNKYWCKSIYSYSFWTRYLEVFDEICIVSKTVYVDYDSIENFLRVDGENITVLELPFARGVKQYISNLFRLNESARIAVKGAMCGVFRLPSVPGYLVLRQFRKLKKPYSLEVVADPYDAYSENKIAKFLFTAHLKKEALRANGVSYVTKYYLQKKYPSKASLYGETPNYFQSYYSTINLQHDYFGKRRKFPVQKDNYTLIHTANNINNDVKGHEVVINVVKGLRDLGYNVDVVFIGDGRKRGYFEKVAERLGVGSHVSFTGTLSDAEKVRDELLKGDIFIFPTKAEGLPRAVIEAMAVGLPCLSTPVNGIPELLENEFLFDPQNVDGFVNKIVELINHPSRLEDMSLRNITLAREYTNDKLTTRRNEFYIKLKELASNQDYE